MLLLTMSYEEFAAYDLAHEKECGVNSVMAWVSHRQAESTSMLNIQHPSR
jgi:hypothetical protein